MPINTFPARSEEELGQLVEEVPINLIWGSFSPRILPVAGAHRSAVVL